MIGWSGNAASQRVYLYHTSSMRHCRTLPTTKEKTTECYEESVVVPVIVLLVGVL